MQSLIHRINARLWPFSLKDYHHDKMGSLIIRTKENTHKLNACRSIWNNCCKYLAHDSTPLESDEKTAICFFSDTGKWRSLTLTTLFDTIGKNPDMLFLANPQQHVSPACLKLLQFSTLWVIQYKFTVNSSIYWKIKFYLSHSATGFVLLFDPWALSFSVSLCKWNTLGCFLHRWKVLKWT